MWTYDGRQMDRYLRMDRYIMKVITQTRTRSQSRATGAVDTVSSSAAGVRGPNSKIEQYVLNLSNGRSISNID